MFIFLFIIIFILQSRAHVNRYDQILHSNNNKGEKDQLYSEIVKNITHMNIILEELIENYAKIKRFFHSEEVISEDVTSDGEVDKVFKERAESKKHKSPKNTHQFSGVTEMFFSEEKNHNHEDYQNSDTSEGDVILTKTAGTCAIAPSNNSKISRQKDNIKISGSVEIKNKASNITSEEYDENRKLDDTHKEGKLNNKEKFVTLIPNEKISNEMQETNTETTKFIDSYIVYTNESAIIKPYQTRLGSEMNDRIIRIDQIRIGNETFGGFNLIIKPKDLSRNQKLLTYFKAKTPPSISPHRFKLIRDIQSRGMPATKSLRAIIDSEADKVNSFSVNKSLATNTKDRMKKLSIPENRYSENEKVNVRKGFQLYSRYPGIVKMGSNAEKISDQARQKSLQHAESFNDNLSKEQLNFRSHRKAYGDACLKVVVKKCWKACKAALKDVCKEYKCTESFSIDFRSKAKAHCITEFQGTASFYKRPGSPNRRTDNNEHPDISQSNIMVAACFPIIARSVTQLPGEENFDGLLKAHPKLILRDRYEKECQKASAKKCENACSNAMADVCATTECKEKKEKFFKKKCKKACKRSYKGKPTKDKSRGKHGSESGSGSDSGSSSSHSESEDSSASSSDTSGNFRHGKRLSNDPTPTQTIDLTKLKRQRLENNKIIINNYMKPIAGLVRYLHGPKEIEGGSYRDLMKAIVKTNLDPNPGSILRQRKPYLKLRRRANAY